MYTNFLKKKWSCTKLIGGGVQKSFSRTDPHLQFYNYNEGNQQNLTFNRNTIFFSLLLKCCLKGTVVNQTWHPENWGHWKQRLQLFSLELILFCIQGSLGSVKREPGHKPESVERRDPEKGEETLVEPSPGLCWYRSKGDVTIPRPSLHSFSSTCSTLFR